MARILMPVDGSPHGERVAAFVARLAAALQVEVYVFTAREPIDLRARAFLSAEDVEREYAAGAARDTATICKMLADAGVRHEVRWKAGDPAETIIAECTRLECDHIVMGSRGASPIAAALVGSVAYKVVRAAPVPVTVVR
jgi:nucleotide-binding universal stress UspA family protein